MSNTISALTIKRLNNEYKLIQGKGKLELVDAFPCPHNILEWNFLLIGPSDCDYHNGYYMGKMVLPQEYPAKSGDIILLTPSGRFEVGKKICLSNTGYHPESASTN